MSIMKPLRNSAIRHRTSDELRVFISSTFRDLYAEREYLIKKVFPELRDICRSRGVEFTEIDLRWGLTHEQASLGKVIRTCLEEIDHCRPYFIGILGDRYGWVPAFHEVQKDPDLIRNYPWIEDLAAAGASITEIEFLYGALMEPSDADGAFFYIRQRSAVQPDLEGDESQKLDDLIVQVRAGSNRVREFISPATLGAQVKEDLLRVIEERWPLDKKPTPLEVERRAHEAFAFTRRKAYIPNPSNLKRFKEFIEEGGEPLVISAESGAGKSSLIAYLNAHYLRHNPDAFVITHYIGATSAACDHLSVIRHLIEEVRDRYDLEEEIPSTPEELEKAFPEWLAKVNGEELVLFIDALNQLESVSSSLGWLPQYLPPAIRLIVSTTTGPSLKAVIERGWNHLHLQPLQTEEREALIVRFLGEYNKSLDPRLVRRIAQDPKSSSPLFLRTLLEELRLFGEFDSLDEHVDHYLMSNDLNDLFRWVLERMERDYGAELLRHVLTLISASRRGLSESELLEITGATRADLSGLLHALDYHLLRRDGRLDFFHSYLRRAVERRYLAHHERERDAHLRLVEYFERQEVSERVADELPWQLQEAGEWERLAECISGIETFVLLKTADKEYELLEYWRRLGDRVDVVEAYRESLVRYEGVARDEVVLAQVLDQIGTFLRLGSRFDGAEILFRRTLEIRERMLGSDSLDTAKSLLRLGDLFVTKGNYDEAEELISRALAIRLRSAPDDLYTAETLHSLGSLLYLKRRYREAESALRQALSIHISKLGMDHSTTARTMGDVGAALWGQRDYEGAKSLLSQALEICERAKGVDHAETAVALNNLGALLVTKGEVEQAIPLLERALAINEKLYGVELPERASFLINLGYAYSAKLDYPNAERCYRRALAIDEKVFGVEHPATARDLTYLGSILREQGDFDGAEQALRQGLEIREKVLGIQHIDTIESHIHIARLHKDRGDYRIAEALYRHYVRLKEELLGVEHPLTVKSLAGFADLLKKMGKGEEAELLEGRIAAVQEQSGSI